MPDPRQCYEAERKRSKNPASMDALPEVLAGERLFQKKDIAATEPIPPFREAVDYRFRLDGGKIGGRPSESKGKKGESVCSVLIKASGSLEDPTHMRGEHLSPKALVKGGAGAKPLEAHRPAWLEQVYTPKVSAPALHSGRALRRAGGDRRGDHVPRFSAGELRHRDDHPGGRRIPAARSEIARTGRSF